MSENAMWDPESHVGYFCQVWSGESLEHYAIFPIPDALASVKGVKDALGVEDIGAVLVKKRGAMGVVSVVDSWRR